MIKTINAIMVFTSIAGLVGVYALKYSVEDIATDKAAIERKIDRQKGELSLLQADWSYLNQPAHVAPIVAPDGVHPGVAPQVRHQLKDVAHVAHRLRVGGWPARECVGLCGRRVHAWPHARARRHGPCEGAEVDLGAGCDRDERHPPW